jgi:hypothetical protein
MSNLEEIKNVHKKWNVSDKIKVKAFLRHNRHLTEHAHVNKSYEYKMFPCNKDELLLVSVSSW